MNLKICMLVLACCAVLGSIYEYALEPIHGTVVQQNDVGGLFSGYADQTGASSHQSEDVTSQGVLVMSQGQVVTSSHTLSENVTSQGAFVMGSDVVNGKGHTGKGVRVAVIDAGFDIYNPEIAGNIAGYESFWVGSSIAGEDSDGIRHGTAVAEIIVDVAPDVELYLYNASTAIEFLTLVDHIIERGDIDVVSMSLGWFNSIGPVDGTSIVSQKIDEARDSGILWINAAGNSAERHWEGRFYDPDGDGWHNFQFSDETITMRVDDARSLMLVLSWDDWDLRLQDYELCLFEERRGQYHPIGCSVNIQNGFLPPVEIIYYEPQDGKTVHVAIKKYSADRDVTFHLFSAQHDFEEYAVPSSSILIPADARGSLSVGASHWQDDVLAGYSSRGPTINGSVKPDLTGPTGVIATGYCSLDSCRPFHGTSSAAPHVAGAAALVMEKYPHATADQVQMVLENIVSDLHPKSNLDGTGRVDVSMLAGSDILALDSPDCGACFFPETLTVTSGDTVTWVNAGTAAVRIIGYSDSQFFESTSIERGERYSRTFDGAGTFEYRDAAHPWASGMVVVADPALQGGVSPDTEDDQKVAEPATIRGMVFFDDNGNGIIDEGESGVPGYTMQAVELANPGVVLEAVTDDSDGTYVFDVTPSAVTLVQTTHFPPDHIVTTGSFYSYVEPAEGQTVTFDVGFYRVPQSESVTLDITAYVDENANGIMDEGEGAVPNTRVSVYTYTTGELETVVTDVDGTALLRGLIPADFLVQAAVPEGYAAITSPEDPVSGILGTLTVTDPVPGSTVLMDIGLVPAL